MDKYFHSVVLDKESCKGCTNCMQRCPTGAIRIRDKKAIIIKERCIDCGECIKVCPYHAQNAVTEDLNLLSDYKYKIVIPSISLYGQFTYGTDMDKVFNGIEKLGFDYVYDEALATDLASVIIRHEMNNRDIPKPVISSLCPAVVRLIQSKFPSLMDNIIKIESPMEIAARIAKKKIMEEKGLVPDDIGVFYLTPCPAKVTSIKKPIGIKKSYVDAAISIKKVYGSILKSFRDAKDTKTFTKGSKMGAGWARVSGQSQAVGINNYIAADGIENVMKILEEIELGKLNDIDYVELLACTGGCVGGPLNVENPFIAKSRIRRLSDGENQTPKIDEKFAMELYNTGYVSWTEEIHSNEIMELDKDIVAAIKKIDMIRKLTDELPGLDCGSCGAPSCLALAEDIVRGYAKIGDCIFRRKEHDDN